MAMATKLSIAATALLFIALSLSMQPTEAQIGVCYGRNGDNLPSQQDVVNLYKSNGIGQMRIYDPDQATLQAVKGTDIKLIVDVPKDQLQSLGSDSSAAMQWVQTNVVPFASSIKYIAVGNEVLPSAPEANSVRPAMDNILNALNSANLGGQIKVSTAIFMTLIQNSFPPSSGEFTDMSYMGKITDFLTSNGFPLLLNVYPYVAYTENSGINLDYALLNPTAPPVTDSGNQLQYHSLFDAQLDSVYMALAKAGASNTVIVVSESGWPSDGGDAASVDNAQTYYRNLINHVKQGQGTPLKPQQAIETFLFAMFDEDKKDGNPTEQHFGLFTPDQRPKYQLSFN